MPLLRRALICLGTLLLNYYLCAQNYLNYSRVWIAKHPIQSEAEIIASGRTNQEVIRTTEYFDGFGRSVQSIIKQGSPLQKDVVDLHIYDSWGREVQKKLPFVSSIQQAGDITNDGNYKVSAIAQQSSFNLTLYPGENNYYYSQTSYENSPLNRVINVFAPGNSWVGSSRSSSVQYLVNTIDDNVRIWTTHNLMQGVIPTGSSSYPAGALYKTINTDEHGVQQIEFKDKNGQLILKKLQLTSAADLGAGNGHAGWLCTYYVYDDYGNMRFVITPKAVTLTDGSWTISTTIADELCIRKEYDVHGRIIIKKDPGSQEQWFIYDKRGRLVMSQDGFLRSQQKWQYFKYDLQDRPTATGLVWDPANFMNPIYHRESASNSTSYPDPTSYSYELLSETYYDNYNWISGTGLGSSLDASNTSNTNIFMESSNTIFPYPEIIAQSPMNRGLITGAKTEVLGSNGAQYLYRASFYDNKGRVVQTQSTNLTNQVDKVTTQYSWTGSPLRRYVQHSKGTPNPQSHNIVTKLTYDDGFRLLNVKKAIISTIGNSAAVSSGDKLITAYSYDENGQLKSKSFGSSLESLTYDYNIRGWLTGINKNYTIAGSSSNYFGMELAYDKTTTTSGTTSFQYPVYNGNMAGQIWKQRGDGIARKYDFTYDKASRLTVGSFLQNTTSSTWDKSYIDYSLNSMAYDNNGNITHLHQNGFVLGGNPNIDNLTYNYENTGTSNKIQNVVDVANNAQSKLGDFHYSGTKSSAAIDYSYNANGSQTSDVNRNISSISYNALNLPATIAVTGKGTITYTYDAAGNKLRKTVQENGAVVPFQGTNYTTDITTVTIYIGEFIYQSKTFTNSVLAANLNQGELLHFAANEEGRVRFVTPPSGTAYHAFDYFLRDHLGNIRTTLTDEQPAPDTYPAATLEAAGIVSEQKYYDIKNDPAHIIPTNTLTWYNGVTNSSYPNSNGLPVSADPTVNPTGSSATLYKLNGATGDRYGIGIALKVMAGDVLKVYGRSVWHQNGTTNNINYPLNSVLSSFVNAFAGTSTVVGGSKGVASGSILNGNSSTTGPLSSWLTTGVPTPSGSTPKAYINWIFFDEQFKPVANGNGYDPVWAFPDHVKPHSITGISVPKSGYVYIYCSNESNQDVYFDNLQVVHARGPILEEQNFYPQGLAMFAINGRAHGKLQTNFGYQGKEMQRGEFFDGTGLEEYDFMARYYDPQLGRWWAQDPAGQFATPYGAMGGNWPVMADPDGKFAWALVAAGALIGGVTKGISTESSGGKFWDGFWRGAIVGAVSGTLGQYGGGTFLSQVAWGAGEGAITGAISAGLNQKNFWESIKTGAAWGAAFATVTSTIESYKNYKDGYGFGTNDGRLNNMVKNYNKALGPKGRTAFANRAIDFAQKRYGFNSKILYTYDDDLESVYGIANPIYGEITLSSIAFRNSSTLKATMAHELGHINFADLGLDAELNGGFPFGDPDLRIDGPHGYASEIYNAGKLHLIPSHIKSANPLFGVWQLYKGPIWPHFLPQRFRSPLVFKPF
ncbi:MAG TPA: DUF6443 domain-containing protein [Flavisolibacter sp.]|nr:DUF6443 domain-containing protein [Flavisolibacter sp.]